MFIHCFIFLFIWHLLSAYHVIDSIKSGLSSNVWFKLQNCLVSDTTSILEVRKQSLKVSALFFDQYLSTVSELASSLV